MDLNHVSVFVRVVESGSFTAAGESLGLPKSSVSRTVSKLEDELGVRLLARTTRSLHLTEPGRTYYERARHALASLEEAADAATDEGLEPRGVVRLTAPTGVGSSELAALVTRFTSTYPEIHVEVAITNRYVDLVAEGFDLAIRGGVLDDSDLVAKQLGKADFGLFASPRYLDEFGRPKTLAELASHRCIMHNGRGGRQEWTLSDADGVATTVEVRGPISVDETIFVHQTVEVGAGIGLLPLVVLARCQSAGHMQSVERVLPQYTRRGGAVWLVSQPLELLPRRAKLFRDFLAENLTPIFSLGLQ